MNILVVDDEPKIVEIISAYLKNEGYNVLSSFNGIKALEIFKSNPIDLVILDLMLPDLSGEKVCHEIKKISEMPVIMLTAKVQEEEILKGFSLGSDDYITKPFSPKILVARVKAILSRTQDIRKEIQDEISFNNGDLVINIKTFEVKKNNIPIFLTLSEFKILKTFIENPKKVFTRNELLDKIVSDEIEIYDRTIDSHIKNIRSKIEDNTKSPLYIITIYGVGYRFGGDSHI
ncbi:MAG: response regulator transcription factor [Sebaldella sp.]|nr:response regulator transcription factor [Sebaldella sp.]